MKKIFYLLLMMLAIGNNVFAEEIKLRVGYVPDTGFLEEDRQGHIRGYGYEYMEFLSRYGNWKFEYVPCTSWADCGEKLQNGTIELLPAMPGDYRSLKNVTRTDHVIGRYPMALITKDGKVKSQMKIGTNSSNAPVPSFAKVAEQENFKYELVNFKNFFEMEEGLRRDEIDGYIAPVIELGKQKNIAAIFDRQSYRLLVKSENKELLAAMNTAMDEMLMDQPNIRNRLNDKYLRAGGASLILNKQEKDFLSEKGKLTTAILMKDKPYAYHENGELHGVIPAVVKQISEDLNVEIEIIETETPADASNLIQRGAIDFIADAVCDFSWAKTLNMAPTQSYLSLDYVAVTRRGEEIKKNSVVACVPDLLYTKTFIYPRYAESDRFYCKSLEECFSAVSDGSADILFAPRSEVTYLLGETGAYNLEVASESNFSDEISLGVNIDADKKLWRILNKEVNHMDLGKIRNIVNEDMAQTANSFSLQWQLYHHPLRVIGAMFFIILIIAAAVWYRMYLKRKHLNIVQRMAYTDTRYQLPNLTWFETEAKKFLNKFEDAEENLYILAFKIDDFSLNIIYKKNLLTEQVRHMAAELNQTAGILLTATGNEKNSLISLCKEKNSANISRIAREIVRKCGGIETKDARLWINIKVGIADADKNNFHQSVEQAQTACQQSKKEVTIFDTKLQESLDFAKKIEEKMESALQNGEFQAWYQTEYELQTHKPIGEEAFVRWQSPEFGFLMPEKFMPIFERNGFIISVDYFMLEEVCKLQKNRLDEGKKLLPVAVNQSGLHFSEEDYLDKMRKTLKKYNLPKGVIKLEFSEKIFQMSINIEQEKRLTNIINSLQKIGFKIATDDFGSGFSSYKVLNYISPDEMKIDGSLLYGAMQSDKMHDILQNIIDLGNKMKMKVICEGIETKAQENLLLRLGCRYGQGFIFQ